MAGTSTADEGVEEAADQPRVFKTEGDGEGREGDVIKEDKKDITVLADQEEKRPQGAPWNPALLGPSTSAAAPAKPTAFRPPGQPPLMPSTFAPFAAPNPGLALFPITPQWPQVNHVFLIPFLPFLSCNRKEVLQNC